MIVRVTRFLSGILLAWAGYVIIANRLGSPADFERARVQPPRAGGTKPPGGEISVLSWNIGYGGMGREADFVADGGAQSRPESRALVERNLMAICAFLQSQEVDVTLLQEVARGSWNTYGIGNLDPVTRALPASAWIYKADWATRGMPPGFRVLVGNAIFSRLTISAAERRALPLEADFVLGIFRKSYRMHIVRVPRSWHRGEWVFVNIHFAAFDPGAEVRRKQLDAVRRFAVAEYAKGNLVVVGGDWNLAWNPVDPEELKRHAPYTTGTNLFWVHSLPRESLPGDGWQWAFDPSSPTNRTAHRPYEKGKNYTLVLDGYLCSPGIEVLETRTYGELEFAHSDHHPVLLRIRESTTLD